MGKTRKTVHRYSYRKGRKIVHVPTHKRTYNLRTKRAITYFEGDKVKIDGEWIPIDNPYAKTKLEEEQKKWEEEHKWEEEERKEDERRRKYGLENRDYERIFGESSSITKEKKGLALIHHYNSESPASEHASTYEIKDKQGNTLWSSGITQMGEYIHEGVSSLAVGAGLRKEAEKKFRELSKQTKKARRMRKKHAPYISDYDLNTIAMVNKWSKEKREIHPSDFEEVERIVNNAREEERASRRVLNKSRR